MTEPAQKQLIQALRHAAAYPHEVEHIEVRETHISWVFLTGEFVYKIKKPVDFGFLDFSTLEKRHFFCDEEIRLNRRLARGLYLETVAICRDGDEVRISGDGQVIEYAVKMRQFDTHQGFDELLARGELQLGQLHETARVLAAFHSDIAVADTSSSFGTATAILQPIQENFQQLHPCVVQASTEGQEQFQYLEQWSLSQHRTLVPDFSVRHAQGFIRECHGDLHLRNIVLWRGKVTPFDGIEFNDNLRWIDVMSELAFLLMDLDDHRRHDLGQGLLNQYLEITGDYAGLAVLRFYQVYRAMVRAKVACLRLQQTDFHDPQAKDEMHNYLELAHNYTQPCRVRLIITHGLSGSGKTYVSQKLLGISLARSTLIRLRSDVERKRLFGLQTTADSHSGIEGGIYDPQASQHTYRHLRRLAGQLLGQGYSVLVDAAFLKQEQRYLFQNLATDMQIPFAIVHCQSNVDLQRQRLASRNKRGVDASEADLRVLQHQLQSIDPLDDHERESCIGIDTTTEPDLAPLLAWLDKND